MKPTTIMALIVVAVVFFFVGRLVGGGGLTSAPPSVQPTSVSSIPESGPPSKAPDGDPVGLVITIDGAATNPTKAAQDTTCLTSAKTCHIEIHYVTSILTFSPAPQPTPTCGTQQGCTSFSYPANGVTSPTATLSWEDAKGTMHTPQPMLTVNGTIVVHP
jgi:hypothetical protein